MIVMAEVMSDDTKRSCTFDASFYVDEADDEDLVDLVDTGCSGELEAGKVAICMKDYEEEVETVLDYCRKEKCGFMVVVDQDSLFEYLGRFRPEVASLLAQIGYS